MLTRFDIDYAVFPLYHGRRFTHRCDDPIEAEDVLVHLLAVRARILAIRHDGEAMAGPQLELMLRVAADRIAAAQPRESPGGRRVQRQGRVQIRSLGEALSTSR